MSTNKFDKDYEGLCISVGGMKGILQLGVIYEFWKNGQLLNLKYYAGSSVGSLLIFLLAIGYSPIEILTFSCDPKFISNFENMNLINIKTIYGIYPQSILKDKLEELVKLKIGFIPTFEEFYEKFDKDIFIALYKLSENNKNKRKIYAGKDTTPNMKITDAIIMSCSIPIIFEKAVYNNDIYIDGGFNDSFPILYLEKQVPHNTNILGILLDTTVNNFDTFIGYITCILYTPITYPEYTDKIKSTTDILKVDIKLPTCSSVKFNISTKDKINMFSEGFRFVQNVMQNVTNKNKTIESKNINTSEQLTNTINNDKDVLNKDLNKEKID